MKYKIQAFQHSNARWEAKYREPEDKIIWRDVVQVAESHLLKEFFPTKSGADNYTVQFLKNKGIEENNIEIIN